MHSLIKEFMMRRQYWDGDLSLATSRPGVLVRCVQLPGTRFHEFWNKFLKKQALLFLPDLKELYVVRSNTGGVQSFEPYFRSGVLLSSEQQQPLRNPAVPIEHGYTLEPFFPFNCFDLVSGSRP